MSTTSTAGDDADTNNDNNNEDEEEEDDDDVGYYVSTFWFVPASRLTDCFVTPAALSRAVDYMYYEREAERGATLLVLKMVYTWLPHLEVQLLQVTKDKHSL